MRDPIYKTEIKITVLSKGPFMVEGDGNDPFDLAAINYAITYGDCLGQTNQISSEQVATDKVVDECLALGNDGEFFNDDEFDEGVDECPYGRETIDPSGICGSCEFYQDCELPEVEEI